MKCSHCDEIATPPLIKGNGTYHCKACEREFNMMQTNLWNNILNDQRMADDRKKDNDSIKRRLRLKK